METKHWITLIIAVVIIIIVGVVIWIVISKNKSQRAGDAQVTETYRLPSEPLHNGIDNADPARRADRISDYQPKRKAGGATYRQVLGKPVH